MARTGAQLLVEGLEAAGVEVVFGLPGVHNLAAWEALRESPIRLVGVRHEQAAVYAADGYARATGRLGVALVTTGPGAANTLGACGRRGRAGRRCSWWRRTSRRACGRAACTAACCTSASTSRGCSPRSPRRRSRRR